MDLLPLFEWLDRSAVGVFMQRSTYSFEAAEMLHLLGLAALGGGILVIDLRQLGLGLKNQSGKQLAEQMAPYLTGALCTSVMSGLLLLAAEPMKCYYNEAFRLKMLFLVLAILFSALVQRPLLKREVLAKPAAAVSLVLWLAVVLAGRAIGVI